MNYVTQFDDKKSEMDDIKSTIEADSSKKAAVSMTHFLCFIDDFILLHYTVILLINFMIFSYMATYRFHLPNNVI